MTPSIALRSPQNALRSPFERGFDRPFDRFVRPSHTLPHTPSAFEALARGSGHRSCHPHSDTAALSLRSRPNALDRIRP
jgi:hypothetical protein